VGRPCTVCQHEGREAIDEAIVAGTPYRTVARRWGVTRDAVMRHRDNHISPALAKVAAEQKRGEAKSLLQRVAELADRTESLLERAEQSGSVVQALAAVRELRGSYELLGRATGELRPEQGVMINLMSHPEFVTVQTRLMDLTDRHPELLPEMKLALGAG
jgi:transposase-like protein